MYVLSGVRGVGKTSIINRINYGLYGLLNMYQHKERKMVQYYTTDGIMRFRVCECDGEIFDKTPLRKHYLTADAFIGNG